MELELGLERELVSMMQGLFILDHIYPRWFLGLGCLFGWLSQGWLLKQSGPSCPGFQVGFFLPT
jgi:hypothetical protein